MNPVAHSNQKLWNDISGINLIPIMFKIGHEEGWSPGQLRFAEQEYRRFLYLVGQFQDDAIVPTKAVDIFWHYHILDTGKYAEDCTQVFGYFLHHFPYFGMRGEEDAIQLARSFDLTCALYTSEFKDTFRKAFPAPEDQSPMRDAWQKYADAAASFCKGNQCSQKTDKISLARPLSL